MFQPFDLIEPVYRPPSEAHSLLVQVTVGCSHNACSFCAMYRTKRFRIRTLPEIREDLEKAARFFRRRGTAPRKVFLCDGDALTAPTELLSRVAETIRTLFPAVVRIGIYASARNVLNKSIEELALLSKRRLSIAYVGVESGDDEVLELLNKDVNSAQTGEAVMKLKSAGWKVSEIIMLGAGGRRMSEQHCRNSAEIISVTSPTFLSLLTTVAVPGTPYAKAVERGEIAPLTVRELLLEMKAIIERIKTSNSKIIFRANHVSNQFPLEGILPRDRENLTSGLSEWIAVCPEGLYPANDFALL